MRLHRWHGRCPPARQQADRLANSIAELEKKSGGRLGVALQQFGNGTIFEYRGTERFAMCSTFKFALAAMTLERSGLRDRKLAFTPDEILSYAPYTNARANLGWMQCVGRSAPLGYA